MKMLALALGVWGLGATSAAALTIDLNRAPTPRAPLIDVTLFHTEAPRVVKHLDVQSPVLSIPPVTIVGRRIERPLGVTSMQKP
ncbi:MAG TPA: hypothetical protein VF765_01315 [Polyangiaceae bacterium]